MTLLDKVRKFMVEQPIANIVGIFLILCTAVIAPFYGGWDYLEAFRKETLSGIYDYTYNPLPAYWFFYLFAILPPITGYFVWNLVNAVGFIYALNKWKTNMTAFAISLMSFWNFFGGQFEGVLVAAIVIALTANPWLAGIGVFILTFKPQVGAIVILFALIKRRDWRILVIPAWMYLLSFVLYGWWVPDWLARLWAANEITKFGNTNISMYPVGILFLTLIFRYRDSLKIWMLTTSLAMPYYPVYSLSSYFSMEAPSWWISVGIWIFYIIPSTFPHLAFITQYAYLIPLLLITIQIIKEERNKNNLVGSK